MAAFAALLAASGACDAAVADTDGKLVGPLLGTDEGGVGDTESAVLLGAAGWVLDIDVGGTDAGGAGGIPTIGFDSSAEDAGDFVSEIAKVGLSEVELFGAAGCAFRSATTG